MIDVLVSLGYFGAGTTQSSAPTHGCLASYACPPCRCAVFTLKAPLVGAPEQVWHSLANLVSLPARSRSPLTATSDADTVPPPVPDHARVFTAALLVARRDWSLDGVVDRSERSCSGSERSGLPRGGGILLYMQGHDSILS